MAQPRQTHTHPPTSEKLYSVKNEIYERSRKLEIDLSYTNCLLASDHFVMKQSLPTHPLPPLSSSHIPGPPPPPRGPIRALIHPRVTSRCPSSAVPGSGLRESGTTPPDAAFGPYGTLLREGVSASAPATALVRVCVLCLSPRVLSRSGPLDRQTATHVPQVMTVLWVWGPLHRDRQPHGPGPRSALPLGHDVTPPPPTETQPPTLRLPHAAGPAPTTTRHFPGAVACGGHDGPLKEGAEHRDGPAAA